MFYFSRGHGAHHLAFFRRLIIIGAQQRQRRGLIFYVAEGVRVRAGVTRSKRCPARHGIHPVRPTDFTELQAKDRAGQAAKPEEKMDKVAERILHNLQLCVTNVHIR